MLPLAHSLRLFLFALLRDENAARRQIRLLIGAVAASGGIWADQLSSLGAGPHLVTAVRVAAFLCMVGVAVHGDPVTPAEVQS